MTRLGAPVIQTGDLLWPGLGEPGHHGSPVRTVKSAIPCSTVTPDLLSGSHPTLRDSQPVPGAGLGRGPLLKAACARVRVSVRARTSELVLQRGAPALGGTAIRRHSRT